MSPAPHRRLHAVRHHQHRRIRQSVSLEDHELRSVQGFTPIRGPGPALHAGINRKFGNSVANIALAKEGSRQVLLRQRQSSAIVSARPLPASPASSLARALQEFAAGLTTGSPAASPYVRRCADRPAHVNGKALKALAVTTKQPRRCCAAPDHGRDREGFRHFTSWQGYFGPANMPKDMVTKLNAEIRKIVERPISRASSPSAHGSVSRARPEEFRRVPQGQLCVEKLIADAGIEKQ